MAQQQIVRFIDDLDGSEAVGTVTFALDKRAYEIDLSDANTDKLHEALAPFIEYARKLSRAGKTTASSAPSKPSGYRSLVGREQVQAVREWCNANGHPVSDRGRIPKAAQAAFDAAH